jgi:hypothetical protein
MRLLYVVLLDRGGYLDPMDCVEILYGYSWFDAYRRNQEHFIKGLKQQAIQSTKNNNFKIMFSGKKRVWLDILRNVSFK